VHTTIFKKFDKLLAEPRNNIRQQLSKQFALKLEGNLKSNRNSIIDFEDDF
jgi:hypothetical protein